MNDVKNDDKYIFFINLRNILKGARKGHGAKQA